MVMTNIELADHLNGRVLLADRCGFSRCVIGTGGDRGAATMMAWVANATGMTAELGSVNWTDGDGWEYWVVVSWA